MDSSFVEVRNDLDVPSMCVLRDFGLYDFVAVEECS